MQIDPTPLDVLVVLDDGTPGRVELTAMIDVATRTVTAAVLRPSAKSADASVLLARTLTSEPMRPGWSDALRMSRSVLPHQRLASLDERLEHAAARPVIVPHTIVCVQFAGKKREGLDSLRWREAVEPHRPFLSHSELEAFFSRPSDLYELIFSVLGLGDLTAAAARLGTARKTRDDGLKQVTQDLPALLERLDSLPDERARSCFAALSRRERDVALALSVATGSAVAEQESQ